MCVRKRRVPLRHRHRPRFKRLAPARRGNINVSMALVAVTEGITDLLGTDGLVGISHIPRAVRSSLYADRGASGAVPKPEAKEPEVFVAGHHVVKRALKDRRLQDAEDARLFAEAHPLAAAYAA